MDFSQTEDGDLALTVDFDAKIGDDQQNALARLVEYWRYNEPWLRESFEYVMRSFETDRLLDKEVWEIASRVYDANEVDRYHEIKDEMGILTFGRAASTGAIMVVLTNLLRRLWVDLGRPTKWESSGPHFAGYSFGQIVEAAANDFRHNDEWARIGNEAPDPKRQLPSIAAIANVLGKPIAPDGSRHPIRGKFGPQVLVAVSDSSYDLLNERLFAFARALANV